jgi:hypothetical protein
MALTMPGARMADRTTWRRAPTSRMNVRGEIAATIPGVKREYPE